MAVAARDFDPAGLVLTMDTRLSRLKYSRRGAIVHEIRNIGHFPKNSFAHFRPRVE